MSRKKKIFTLIIVGIAMALLTMYLFCLPRDLFKGTSYSTIVLDRNGELLGARIAGDSQWRFPESEEDVPEKFRISIIQFEDRWFRFHPGVNPFSVVRAAVGNMKAGHVTSGGSTITMQVIRLSRGKDRTFGEKIKEAVLATRLELRYSKDRILSLYCAHAPFGGNVVGLEAAAWRYFGKPAGELSWGESAMLAVLPNSPSGMHPGKNREKLEQKRNRLLKRLLDKGYIDSLDYELAIEEPIPPKPYPLPDEASHLTQWYCSKSPGKRIVTDIDIHLQRQVEEVTSRWRNDLSSRGINDLAAVVVEVATGKAVAYVGNADPKTRRSGSDVDIARSPRSTGSILKPVLFCSLLQDGDILPGTLLPDIPVNINGFSPQNFNRQFLGAVPASEALSRSLNVPAVHMLRKYGVPKFLDILRKCGMTTLGRSASDYGLSLILGGAEGSLIDITRVYAAMSAEYQKDGQGEKDDWFYGFPLEDKCALWHTFEALKEVNRPDEIDWRLISSVKKIAWKTGTSYGFRDAWAVGVTPGYAVGVWAGNAQGQGVPGLTGARASGPVMFDIFNLLPTENGQRGTYASNGWFLKPVHGEYFLAEVCPRSGYLKGMDCEDADTLMLPRKCIKSEPCPYHQRVEGVRTFILPPSMEWYYRQHNPQYKPYIPKDKRLYSPMEFIYPENGSVIYIPRQLDGSIAGITFNLAHRTPAMEVFWHLDNEYIGKTAMIHQMVINPSPGKHSVTAVDDCGNTVTVSFSIEENSYFTEKR